MLRIVVLHCPTLYLRRTASGTCCATLLQRCKQAAWRHLEAANCHVFRHRWKTLDSGLATVASVWQRLDNAVQRLGKYNMAWSRCTTLCCVAQLMATLYHRWRTLDSLCATLLQRCKKAAQRHLLCGNRQEVSISSGNGLAPKKAISHYLNQCWPKSMTPYHMASLDTNTSWDKADNPDPQNIQTIKMDTQEDIQVEYLCLSWGRWIVVLKLVSDISISMYLAKPNGSIHFCLKW